MAMVRPTLGRGLSALLSDNANESEQIQQAVQKGAVMEVLLDDITPNPNQPRRLFRQGEIEELAASIKEKGVLQPLLLRNCPPGTKHKYEIIAGERRWRAAREAGIRQVPAIIKSYSDNETLEVALIENIQREDLSPIEEASAYKKLMEAFGYTYEAIAEKVSKSRSHIMNLIRLLNLPEEVKRMVDEGTLSMGHARAIIMMDDPATAAQEIIKGKMTVRDAERMANLSKRKTANKEPVEISDFDDAPRGGDIDEIRRMISNTLNVPVVIEQKGTGGQIIISYKNFREFDALIQKLGV